MLGKKKIAVKRTEKLQPEEYYKRVAIHAYEIWQKKGCRHGDEWADWFEAEKLIKANSR